MYKILLLATVALLFVFYIPQSFSESIEYSSWSETAQLVIDEKGGKTSVSLGVMSKNPDDIMIPELLESMILNSPRLIGISYTNQYDCVPGVEEVVDYELHEFSCVMIDVTRPSEIRGLVELKTDAQAVGDSFIGVINKSFGIDAEFHSVFINRMGLTSDLYKSKLTVTYIIPKKPSVEHFDEITAPFVKDEIHNGGGFFKHAQKMAEHKDSVFSFSLVPVDNRVLRSITVLMEDWGQYDITNMRISLLELLMVDTLERSKVFTDGFYPLNSIISLTVIPDQNSQITELNSNLIIDPANIEELKTGGWYFDSSSTSELGEVISGKYLFGTESSVDREDMYLIIGNNDGTEPVIHNDVIVEENASDNPSYDEAVKQATEFKERGGCLIATAAFGSEMAPQVQFLREIRDNTVLKTESGTAFMTSFNQFYYSFSPTIADYERENPVFKEVVKLTLTPLLTSLTLLQYADIDSESEMLGYGIGVILLNIGMYFIVPALVIIKIKTIKKI
ncbi:MAG TPA: CFI-box-CTERM domain-containing protein [Candidatus Nitrosopelagicus sp.]|jgi:hypothetical protein|nr:CFI-box-CTERM domain-containing protein [Candidatus Nitrosopelagicus sp.]|tara:strand:+ start:257 stop:1774 length:1518 start_codon:yes stop_codon:yes gene_type:complete